jgi:tRNA threonylcarbamoyladenosine biosynthesis protein TsaE
VISLRIQLGSLAATQRLGSVIAQHLHPGDRLFLIGEIGSGKTTLARAVGVSLHAEPPLTSPTFLLVSEHQGTLPIWHADAYRLPPGSDPLAAGLIDERHAAGVTIIEWPEQVDWPIRGDGTTHLEVELTAATREDERIATMQIGDAERARSLRAALLSVGLEVSDGA